MKLREYLITVCQADHKKVDQFLDYHRENPQVWKGFEKITLELISRGKRGYSAIQIMGIIRYNSDISGNDGFKANNNYSPFFSRCFVFKYPQHQDFFEFRELKSKKYEYEYSGKRNFGDEMYWKMKGLA